jgi:hypothetical protein
MIYVFYLLFLTPFIIFKFNSVGQQFENGKIKTFVYNYQKCLEMPGKNYKIFKR